MRRRSPLRRERRRRTRCDPRARRNGGMGSGGAVHDTAVPRRPSRFRADSVTRTPNRPMNRRDMHIGPRRGACRIRKRRNARSRRGRSARAPGREGEYRRRRRPRQARRRNRPYARRVDGALFVRRAAQDQRIAARGLREAARHRLVSVLHSPSPNEVSLGAVRESTRRATEEALDPGLAPTSDRAGAYTRSTTLVEWTTAARCDTAGMHDAPAPRAGDGARRLARIRSDGVEHGRGVRGSTPTGYGGDRWRHQQHAADVAGTAVELSDVRATPAGRARSGTRRHDSRRTGEPCASPASPTRAFSRTLR